MFITVLCIVCVALYLIMLLLSFCIKKSLESACSESGFCSLTGGAIANRILQKHSVVSKENIENENDIKSEKSADENDENVVDEDDEYNVRTSRDYSRHRKRDFVYPSEDEYNKEVNEEIEIEKGAETNSDVSYPGVVSINDTSFTYKIDESRAVVKLSPDLHNSTSLGAQVAGAYSACHLISSINKPLIFSFISFLTALPSLVLQLGWVFCCINLFELLYLPNTVWSGILWTVIISFVLQLLKLFYCFYLKNIVKENIEEYMEDGALQKKIDSLIFWLSLNNVLGGFGFIRWFVRSFLGYKI